MKRKTLCRNTFRKSDFATLSHWKYPVSQFWETGYFAAFSPVLSCSSLLSYSYQRLGRIPGEMLKDWLIRVAGVFLEAVSRWA